MEKKEVSGMKKRTAKKRIPAWLYVLLVVILAVVSIWQARQNEAEQVEENRQVLPVDGTLTVRFLDVGQGDSALIVCKGQTMLIDGGSVSEGQFLVSRLSRLGVSELDYVVNTHPDEDHCGGLAGVLAKYPAQHVYSSVTEHTTKVFSNVVKYAEEQGQQIEVPQTGDSWYVGDASVTCIGPVGTYSDSNNGSLVLRVDFGETSFLFTGDMEQKAEADLLESGADVRADVLKVGHHGSPTSSSQAFLEAVAPSIAVISVGEDNDYGHPNADVLSRLEALGAELYRTDTQGEIIVRSDGQTLTVTTDKTSRTPSAEQMQYVGNKNSQILHSPDCAKLPSEENRVYFESVEQAEIAGYKKHTCIK